MKRLAQVLLVMLVVGAVLSSCKSHDACPAYSSNDLEQLDSKI